MRNRLISVLTAAVLVASACGQSSSSASPSARPSALVPVVSTASAVPLTVAITATTYKATPALSTTGKVVLAEWRFPDTVNPYYALYPTDIEVADSLFDGLLRVTPDLKYVPDLAKNVPTLNNGGVVLTDSGGMDVTWNLRPAMKWSDGKPINCDDIQATWQWIMSKDNSNLAGGTIGWQDVSGVDGGTGTDCVMHFSKVYEAYLSLVNPVLPAHYITTVPVKDAASKLYPISKLTSGVYSGPYIPLSVDGRASITLKPNQSWSTIGGHAPWLTSVTWKYYGDANTMIDGFENGEFDVGQGLTNLDMPSLADVDPTLQVIHDSMTYEVLAFNNAWFQNKYGSDAANIIQAIKLTTDRQALAKLPLVGSVGVINNPVSPLSWYYKDVVGSTTADSTTAYALLANSGWIKGKDGYLSKGGKIIELMACTTNRQYRLDSLKLMATQLKQQLGIKVNVYTRPDADVFGFWDKTKASTWCNLRHGNFDVAEFAYISPVDPLSGYRIYHSSQVPENGSHTGENISRINLPALDAAYETIDTTADLVRVRDAMQTIQEIYVSDRNTYELPLYFRKDIWLVGSKVHNFTGNPTSSGAEWNIGDWWVG